MSGGGHGGGRGGRRRGGHAEEHENHERWMVTYADMLTLLLVLFIVLYAISSVNVSKFDQLKSSLSSAFNGGTAPSVLTAGSGIVPGQSQSRPVPVGPKGPTFTNKSSAGQAPVATPAAKLESNQFSKIRAAIDASLKSHGLAGDALYTVNERGLVVTVLTNEIVFEGDSPLLLATGQKILTAILPSLNTVDNQIEVDGHTNQLQSSVDGWALSAERAVTVLEYLISHGSIAPKRLTASGHSEYEPLVPPSNPNAANLNRRVDIVVLSKFTAADRVGLFTPSTGATNPTAQSGTK